MTKACNPSSPASSGNSLPFCIVGRRDCLLPFILAACLFLASGEGDLSTPPSFGLRMDLVYHFAAFGALATALIRIPEIKRMRLAGSILTIILVSAYGAFDEWRQSFTQGRHPDIADWIADTLGAITAVTLYQYLPVYQKLMEHPVFRFSRKRQVTPQ